MQWRSHCQPRLCVCILVYEHHPEDGRNVGRNILVRILWVRHTEMHLLLIYILWIRLICWRWNVWKWSYSEFQFKMFPLVYLTTRYRWLLQCWQPFICPDNADCCSADNHSSVQIPLTIAVLTTIHLSRYRWLLQCWQPFFCPDTVDYCSADNHSSVQIPLTVVMLTTIYLSRYRWLLQCCCSQYSDFRH